ncbi:hypothetical protein N7520_009137 [Penicillium odoratum]|uniref:uncharacterized protein n=1 Tax=Penicillium odoratum TaxID=1167516 RepID=UPI002548F17D|nr:uncharacterized protein N7520_009137 [Penicillium odoratum]KAJ5752220.1 hypothetical protein N7520_009137 [Penicillium odoratum]
MVDDSHHALITLFGSGIRSVFKPCKGHRSWVSSVAWSQDNNRLAPSSDDNTIKIWEVSSHFPPTLEGRSGPFDYITWSEDKSRLAASCQDWTIKLWNPTTGQSTSTLKGHKSWDETIKIWDQTTGQCRLSLEGHSRGVSSIAWTQDGKRLASASCDQTIMIWDPATGQCLVVLRGHWAWVSLIAWSKDDGRLASASTDKSVSIWNPATGRCDLVLKGHTEPVDVVAWSQDNSRLESGSSDATARIWDAVTGQSVKVLEHKDAVKSVTWSLRIASASVDETVKIWDPATGQCTSFLSINSPYFLRYYEFRPNLLQTRCGIVEIESDYSSKKCGYGMNKDCPWITHLLSECFIRDSYCNQLCIWSNHIPFILENQFPL